MDRLNRRNYWVVAAAGMFCLLNVSVVSAQTATNLKCSWCVGPGEVSYNAVEWGALDPEVRARVTAQSDDIAALTAAVTDLQAQTATDLNCTFCVGPREIGNNAVGWNTFNEPLQQALIAEQNRVDALTDEVTAQTNEIAALEARVEALEALVATLETGIVPNLGIYLRIDETNPQRPTAWFEAVNVMVVNGTGTTAGDTNGLGNLIVGYDEFLGDEDDNKSGSHNLVVGIGHNYSSFGGFVAGRNNTVSREYASVSGGRSNTASGRFSSVSGGNGNTASEQHSSVSGGAGNTASGNASSVSGGQINTARGSASSVSGGFTRAAPGQFDWRAGASFQED